MKVTKRDGREVEFDAGKIAAAIMKAVKSVGFKFSESSLEHILDSIFHDLKGVDIISVEKIQDIVEEHLMDCWPIVAKAYILYREEHRKLREIHPDSNAIANYIHAAKYSLNGETYQQTVDRVRMMHCDKFPQYKNQIAEKFDLVHSKKVLPSMRSMQFAGLGIERHNARMFNCSYTYVDRSHVFGDIFYLLLCGCGVGYSVQSYHVNKLGALADKIDPFKLRHVVIEDCIEGWADAVTSLLDAYIHGYTIEFAYNKIRPIGSPLSSGGLAPGHLPLKKCLQMVESILASALGRKLRPIECYDILCYIAEAVLSGGIRRSSTIALFDCDDEEMLFAKHPNNFNYNGRNTQRAMSNNSAVFLLDNCDYDTFCKVMRLNRECYGEPGFYFTSNRDIGTNPCGEITLVPKTSDGCSGFAFCNLTEVNAAGCKDVEEFYSACRAASMIGTLQATYNNIPYLGMPTKQIMDSDPLIGVSITGIADCQFIDGDVLRCGAEVVKYENRLWANRLGINAASRCTCIKPSGTSSLELGCVGSGIHAHHSKRYFRRVTANALEPVALELQRINPHMVQVKPNGDLCITFPVETKGLVMSEETEWDFLKRFMFYKNSWVNVGVAEGKILPHNISSTLVFNKDAFDEVVKNIWYFRHTIASMTLLPQGSDKNIPFMPREEVVTDADKALWRELIEKYKPVDYSKVYSTNARAEVACSGGACDLVHSDHIENKVCTIIGMDLGCRQEKKQS